MRQDDARTLPASDRGVRTALMFALVGERLATFYEHAVWLTEAQGATLAGEWLARTGRSLPLAERRALSALSDDLARHMAGTLSREAGLYAAHELSEALDPNTVSELGRAVMAECERRLDAAERA